MLTSHSLRYVGGVTVQKFLDAGYLVRGTVRDPSKHEWMLEHYGPNFTLVGVPNMAVDGAFDEAVKGVAGIAHVASPVGDSYTPDPVVIDNGVRCALTLLEAAGKEPSVKSVVYTSSQAALIMMKPGQAYHMTPQSWNEESKVAHTLPITMDFRRGALNYMCAKTEAEQNSFKWVKEHNPHFTFNTVVPNMNFGTLTRPDKTSFGSSAGLMKLIWDGNPMPADLFPPCYFIDVEDTALLHVAALSQPDVKNERILGIAYKFCYNDVLAIWRKLYPERKFQDDVEEILDMGSVENERAEELLKRVKNGEGWTKLDKTMEKAAYWYDKAEKEGQDWPRSAVDDIVDMLAALPREMRSMYG